MTATPAFSYTENSTYSNATLAMGSHPNLAVLPTQNIFFIDVNSSFGEGAPELVQEENAIKKQIINVLSTSIGSEEFEPEYGSNLPYYLQEPVTAMTAWMIENDTIGAVKRWLTGRISLSRGDCFVQPLDVGQGDIEGYYIRLRYTILRTRAVTSWQFSVYK